MSKQPLNLMAGLQAIVLCLSLTACAGFPLFQPSGEEQIQGLFEKFQDAAEAHDTEGVMALMSDDYVGSDGGGKEEVTQLFEMLDGFGIEMGIDIEGAEVTIDGKSAAVTGVIGIFGDQKVDLDYELEKSSQGWLITSIHD